jgi:hypothetical protein
MDEEILDRLRQAVLRTAEVTSGRSATGRGHDDADDSVGTIGTDDACGFDPFPLLRSLHRAGARAVVIGQVAGILHGSRELTGDLDLLWSGDPVQARPMVAAFAAVGGSLSDDDGAPITLGPDAFLCPKVQFSSPGASGDCCTPALPWGSLDVAAYLDRALTVTDRDGFEIHYLQREDLIRMRRAVGRPKDLRRATEFEHL